MWRTPAPPSTPFVAARIWSGTGEVNTSPGQAASSMPYPTKPPCSGSGPGPPPEGTPALPAGLLHHHRTHVPGRVDRRSGGRADDDDHREDDRPDREARPAGRRPAVDRTQ